VGKRGEVRGDDFSSPLLCSREWRPGFVGGWMIWLPGGWVGRHRQGNGSTGRGDVSLSPLFSLSLIILLFFYFLFIIRRENLEDVRDFVLFGREKLVG